MKKYYKATTRNRHTARTSDEIDAFIYQRMKELECNTFKSYFMSLLIQDGYKPQVNDF